MNAMSVFVVRLQRHPVQSYLRASGTKRLRDSNDEVADDEHAAKRTRTLPHELDSLARTDQVRISLQLVLCSDLLSLST